MQFHAVQNISSSKWLPLNIKNKMVLFKTIILPAVLHGCETWSLKLMDEHRLRANENRALRRILGFKTDEVTGEWRELRDEELHNVYS
jgi:hypothetical protein